MTTALQIVTGALNKAGVLAAGETASADDAADCLETLNTMLDGWNIERLFIYTVTDLPAFNLGIGTQNVTIGPGANIDVPARPVQLEDWMFCRYNGIDYPVRQISGDQFSSLALKTLTSSWPVFYYYEPTLPTGTIHLYPTPNVPMELHVRVQQQLTQFADLATDYALPPGYKKAIVYSLTEELYGDYSRPADPTVMRIAARARAMVKRQNRSTDTLNIDPRALRRYGAAWNIYTGTA